MNAEMPADARAWLSHALEDRGWAQYNAEGRYFAQACFACQQSAEKLLKAFLLAYNAVPPKIHELVKLVGLCAQYDAHVRRFEESARNLDQYHVATRYPDLAMGRRPYTQEEAEKALSLVDEMLAALRPAIEGRIEGSG